MEESVAVDSGSRFQASWPQVEILRVRNNEGAEEATGWTLRSARLFLTRRWLCRKATTSCPKVLD
jgi:hypothetical protein